MLDRRLLQLIPVFVRIIMDLTKTRYYSSVIASAISMIAIAQGYTQVQLQDPDLAHGSGFGHKVAIHGDYAFVSEPGDRSRTGDPGTPEGAVHVYRRNSGGINAWDHFQTLLPDDPAEVAFGWEMAVVGGRLVVLRPINKQSYFGLPIGVFRAIHVFELQNDRWIRTQIIEGLPFANGSTGGSYVSWIWAEFGVEADVRLLAGDSTFVVLDGADHYRLNSGFGGLGTLETQAWWYRIGTTGLFERVAPLFPISAPDQGAVAVWSDEGFVADVAGAIWTVNPSASQPPEEIRELILSSSGLAKRGMRLYAGVGIQGGSLVEPPAVAVVQLAQAESAVEEVISAPMIADDDFGRIILARNNGLLIADVSTVHWYDMEDHAEPLSSVHPSGIGSIDAVDVSSLGDIVVGSEECGHALVMVRDIAEGLSEDQVVRASLHHEGGTVYVTVQGVGHLTSRFAVVDAVGRVMAEGSLGTGGRATIDVGSFLPGMYSCYFPGSSMPTIRFML